MRQTKIMTMKTVYVTINVDLPCPLSPSFSLSLSLPPLSPSLRLSPLSTPLYPLFSPLSSLLSSLLSLSLYPPLSSSDFVHPRTFNFPSPHPNPQSKIRFKKLKTPCTPVFNTPIPDSHGGPLRYQSSGR